jgi:hypothetical protein
LEKYSEAVPVCTLVQCAMERADLALALERGPNRAPARGGQTRGRPAGGERRRWVRCDGCRGKAGGNQKRARASLPWQQSSPRPGGSRLHGRAAAGTTARLPLSAVAGGERRRRTAPTRSSSDDWCFFALAEERRRNQRERGRTEQTRFFVVVAAASLPVQREHGAAFRPGLSGFPPPLCFWL